MKPPWEYPILSELCLPLSYIYFLALKGRNSLYRLALLRPKELPAKLISVGNLNVGGSGKTPVVMRIAQWLKEQGIKVGILSRGYKGKLAKRGVILSDGKNLGFGPEFLGDEPYLVAKSLPHIPQAIGINRFKLGKVLCELYDLQALVLDDGFQYFKLKKDLEILCIPSDLDLTKVRLLPAGPFREGLSSIKRAHLILLTYWEGSKKQFEVLEKLKAFGKPIFVANPFYEGLLEGKSLIPFSQLKGKRLMLCVGIGNPYRLLNFLQNQGLSPYKTLIREDHHRWRKEEIERELKGIEAILTTEKDFVKFPPLEVPVYRVKLRMEMEKGFWEFLKGILYG